MQRVVIVGGGLVGCVMAVYLARRGVSVVVYERNPDPRSGKQVRRPSISMTLCRRGLDSLERAGVMSRVVPILTPALGRIVHEREGVSMFQPYSSRGEPIYAVTRRNLALTLLEAVEAIGIKVAFEHRCVDIDPLKGEVIIENAVGCRHVDRSTSIIAADGCHSAVRRCLVAGGWLDASEHVSTHGYKELPITAEDAAACGLRGDALHMWPRHDLVAGAFPNGDGSFDGSIHMPLIGPGSFSALSNRSSVAALFVAELPDFVRLVPSLARLFLEQRPNSMMAVRCQPWSAAGTVLLVGDAAHAMLPHYGQGANAGLEDCALFSDVIDKYGFNWNAAFEDFEHQRRPDTDAMTDLSDEHSIVLRERVGLPEYQLRARVEQYLHRWFPDRFTPLYSMIAFSTVPYAAARRRDALQQQLVDHFVSDRRIQEMLAVEDRARCGNGVQSTRDREPPAPSAPEWIHAAAAAVGLPPRSGAFKPR